MTARVAHPDGQDVVLRASPREEDRTPRGFMDGDAVTILERSGSDWTRVRGDNGQEGWVPTSYLGP
jgi:SH3-like domain-containing protein